MKVFTVSQDGGPVTTYEGLVIQPHYSFENAPAIDILVVPSAQHSRDTDRENTELIAWVQTAGKEARYVMSLCWGAFILAEAGLLDGGACTTFPSDFDTFAETFPQLEVERGASFVHAGKAITSQGGAKSFDAAMYLVDHLYGEKIAQAIGGGLLIQWPPAKGMVEGRVIAPADDF
jgi:transcriptional regulator GlxA family with amidase domain